MNVRTTGCRINLITLLAVCGGGVSGAVYADESCEALFLGVNRVDQTTSCGVVGASLIGYKSTYTNGFELGVVPHISVIWESLYIDNAEAGVLLWGDLSQQSYSLLTTFVRLSENGYDASEEAQLRGLDDTNEVVEVGVRFSLGGEFGEVQLAFAHDVSSKHKSYVAEASYVYEWDINGYQMALSTGVEYLSKDAAQYFYGVSEDQVSSLRRLYKQDVALNFQAGYSVEKSVTEHWNVFHFASYTLYDNDIKDSPLTVNDNGYSVGLGLSYTF